jgi:hygromycin-B 4-O-kinase
MSIKPQLDIGEIVRLLSKHYTSISELEELHGGHIAQGYRFKTDDQVLVLRIVTPNLANTLAKEYYVYKQFGSPDIPVPAIYHIGTVNGLPYAISRFMEGVPSDQLSQDDYERAIPSVISTLDTIHQQDVSATSGYGFLDSEGYGQWNSWREYLAAIRNEKDDFYGQWHTLFETTFLEYDFWFRVYDALERLLPYCPEERYLLHGDYGYNNILVKNDRVTAVLDWANVQYGDPVFDIQWLASWLGHWDFPGRFRTYYEELNRPIHDYEERNLCYKIYLTLDGLRFFAKANHKDAYEATKRHITDAFAW